MNSIERRTALSVASLMALRMLGLFLLIPVLPVLALKEPGATPALVGLAVGIYGLTQAVLQLPFGWLSDRWGRHALVAVGLCMFVLGGVVAHFSTSIYGIILGRALQGGGAIASALMALLADVSREEQRSKVMAIVGMSIGASFMLAIVMGPVLAQWWNLSQLFLFTACAGLLGLAVLYWAVPKPSVIQAAEPETSEPGTYERGALQSLSTMPFRLAAKQCLSSRPLVMLMGSVCLLHLLITAVFVLFPTWLDQQYGWPLESHWKIYLPLIFLVFLFVFPVLGVVEKCRMHRGLMVLAFTVFGVSIGSFGVDALGFSQLLFGFFLVFLAFSLLEAVLPSLVSRVVPPNIKGTALGLFSTSQFLGAFLGGSVAGLASQFDALGVFFAIVLACCVLWGLGVWLGFPQDVKAVSLANVER